MVDHCDRTPLLFAAYHGHLETAKLIMSYRAELDLNAKGQVHCWGFSLLFAVLTARNQAGHLR